MSWLYSRALVEEYSEGISLDGAPCALSSGTPIQPQSWLPVKTKQPSQLSRSGMTFKPLTEDLGEDVLMSFLEGFPVLTLVALERERGSTESKAVCGDTWHESSVKFDPDSSSWKTHQCLWEEDLPESSVILPKWGMMRDGVCWERTTLELPIRGTGSGLWPTPSANEDAAGTPDGKMQRMLGNCVEVRGETPEEWATGTLNPDWVEWIMGWPVGWTDLKPLETARFRKWPHSHGLY